MTINKRRSDILTAILAVCGYIASQSYAIELIQVPPAIKPWIATICGIAAAVNFAFRNQLPTSPPTKTQEKALVKVIQAAQEHSTPPNP